MIDLAKAQARAEQAMALAKKATAGPWSAERQDDDDGDIYWAIHSDVDYEFVVNVHDATAHSSANAHHIADARTSVPDLARLVLDLVARVRELEGQSLADSSRPYRKCLAPRLVEMYEKDSLATAKLCDEILDRSGNLLGWVRDEVRARQQKAPHEPHAHAVPRRQHRPGDL